MMRYRTPIFLAVWALGGLAAVAVFMPSLGCSGGDRAQQEAYAEGVQSDPYADTAMPEQQLSPADGLPAPNAMSAQVRSATPAESVAESPEAEIDRILAGLKTASIAFNTPEEISYGEVAIIELVMSPTQSESSLAADIRGPGPVETARVKFANLMHAELTGLGFKIEPFGPETQAVSSAEPTVWGWVIEPVRTDVQPLHLTLSARVKIDGESVMRSIKTFDKEIRVHVPLMHRVGSLVFGNLEIVCTLVLAPLAAVAWRKLRKPKQSAGEPPTRVAA